MNHDSKDAKGEDKHSQVLNATCKDLTLAPSFNYKFGPKHEGYFTKGIEELGIGHRLMVIQHSQTSLTYLIF